MKDFAYGEAWLAERKERLTQAHAGKYLYLNAEDLTYAVDATHETAAYAYARFYRRCRRRKTKVPHTGWHIIGWQIPEKR